MAVSVSEWSTRVKQIAKMWRKASAQDRAPYVVGDPGNHFYSVRLRGPLWKSVCRLWV